MGWRSQDWDGWNGRRSPKLGQLVRSSLKDNCFIYLFSKHLFDSFYTVQDTKIGSGSLTKKMKQLKLIKHFVLGSGWSLVFILNLTLSAAWKMGTAVPSRRWRYRGKQLGQGHTQRPRYLVIRLLGPYPPSPSAVEHGCRAGATPVKRTRCQPSWGLGCSERHTGVCH